MKEQEMNRIMMEQFPELFSKQAKADYTTFLKEKYGEETIKELDVLATTVGEAWNGYLNELMK